MIFSSRFFNLLTLVFSTLAIGIITITNITLTDRISLAPSIFSAVMLILFLWIGMLILNIEDCGDSN